MGMACSLDPDSDVGAWDNSESAKGFLALCPGVSCDGGHQIYCSDRGFEISMEGEWSDDCAPNTVFCCKFLDV